MPPLIVGKVFVRAAANAGTLALAMSTQMPSGVAFRCGPCPRGSARRGLGSAHPRQVQLNGAAIVEARVHGCLQASNRIGIFALVLSSIDLAFRLYGPLFWASLGGQYMGSL